MTPRILTLDIETSPIEALVWGTFKVNIGVEQIIKDTTILSFSAKWLGDSKVFYMDTGGRGPNKVRDDRALMKRMWELLNEADIVVSHNGIQFDIRKINMRMLKHKMHPYSPVKAVDTKVVMKRHFFADSNRLSYLSDRLTQIKKDKHKKFPGFELWIECLKDNPKAWAEMKKYNILDTRADEELYLLVRGWAVGHPNVAVYSGTEAVQCGRCGSQKVHYRGSAYTQSGQYSRIQCTVCGGWSRTRYTENTKEKRHSLLSQ